jgi:hypothetical protein
MIAHEWIKEKLHECIVEEEQGAIDNEENIIFGLMERATHITSWEELWTIQAGDVSLFHYHITMLPWFFGLNLVRFMYKKGHKTRSLEII